MKVIYILIFSLLTLGSYAQGLKDVRINEVLVKNLTNYEDDYGDRSSWFEIYNTGHARIKLGGCNIQATMIDGTVVNYQIPVSDKHAEIAPLSYKIFYCTGTDYKGTYYTNFKLDNIKSIALYDASGKGEPIDKVDIIIGDQVNDVSVGNKKVDNEVIFTTLSEVTPGSTNETGYMKPKSVKFLEHDPTGGAMAFTAILVVFSVLCSLFLIFKFIGVYMVRLAHKKGVKSKGANMSADKTSTSELRAHNGEEVAAIAMALALYKEDLHDKESTVLTINRVARAYSPWSSKIYGLRQNPRK